MGLLDYDVTENSADRMSNARRVETRPISDDAVNVAALYSGAEWSPEHDERTDQATPCQRIKRSPGRASITRCHPDRCYLR